MRDNCLILLILCLVFGFLYVIGLGVINFVHVFQIDIPNILDTQ
jgi:hypothetical protein